MSDPNETLERVSYVTGDFSVSQDAMRSSPDPIMLVDEVRGVRCHMTTSLSKTLTASRTQVGHRPWTGVSGMLAAFRVALRRTSRSIHRIGHAAGVSLAPTERDARRLHRSRRRCRLCNPNSNPPPLSVDGVEYQRRRQARKRRRR